MSDAGLHITTSLAAFWLPWVCLAMVILVWLCCILQPQYMRGLMSNSLASFSLGAQEQNLSIGSQLAQWLFNTTIPALAVFVLVTQAAALDTNLFIWLLVVSLAIDAMRALLALMVQYTFRLGKLTAAAYLRYFSLRSLLSYVLFGLMLLIAYTSATALWSTLSAIVALAYLIILGVQWIKLFAGSLLDAMGVVIYLITVELLPNLLLLEAGRQIYLQQFA